MDRRVVALEHIHTIGSIDPRLEQLHAIARPKEKKLAEWLKAERLRQRNTENPELPHWPALVEFVAWYNKQPSRPSSSRRQVLDVGPSNELIIRELDGSLRLLKPDEAWGELVHTYPPQGDIPHLEILDSADEARLALIASVVGPLEPNQRQALILAHHAALSHSRDLHGQAQDLLSQGFSLPLLFGLNPDGTQCEGGFPGLYRLGVIGNSVPSMELMLHVIAEQSSASPDPALHDHTDPHTTG